MDGGRVLTLWLLYIVDGEHKPSRGMSTSSIELALERPEGDLMRRDTHTMIPSFLDDGRYQQETVDTVNGVIENCLQR